MPDKNNNYHIINNLSCSLVCIASCIFKRAIFRKFRKAISIVTFVMSLRISGHSKSMSVGHFDCLDFSPAPLLTSSPTKWRHEKRSQNENAKPCFANLKTPGHSSPRKNVCSDSNCDWSRFKTKRNSALMSTRYAYMNQQLLLFNFTGISWLNWTEFSELIMILVCTSPSAFRFLIIGRGRRQQSRVGHYGELHLRFDRKHADNSRARARTNTRRRTLPCRDLMLCCCIW